MPTATREDVRLRVVQAADELIATVGYNRMTIEELANRAGIGKGTIYLHFRSKEEIALATVDRVVDFAYQEMKRIANEPGPAVERVRAMLMARVLVRLERVREQAWSLDEMLARIRPALLERRRTHFAREAALLSWVIRDAISDGEIPAQDTEEAARALLVGTNSLLPYGLSRRDIDQLEEVKRDAERVIQFLLRALSQAPGDGDTQ